MFVRRWGLEVGSFAGRIDCAVCAEFVDSQAAQFAVTMLDAAVGWTDQPTLVIAVEDCRHPPQSEWPFAIRMFRRRLGGPVHVAVLKPSPDGIVKSLRRWSLNRWLRS